MARSFAAGKPVFTDSSRNFANGTPTREPQQGALEVIKRGAARIVQVSEDEIAEAMRLYFRATHHVAESAGAAPLAALLQERNRTLGKKVGVIPTGGNFDAAVYQKIFCRARRRN